MSWFASAGFLFLAIVGPDHLFWKSLAVAAVFALLWIGEQITKLHPKPAVSRVLWRGTEQ
jgi:hypothetical protein